MTDSQEWWTTTDVANFLGVQIGTVSAYRKRQQMPAPEQTLGRTHLWRPATIRNWQATRHGAAGSTPIAAPSRTDPSEWLVHGERDLYANEYVRLSLVDVEPPHGERFEHHVVSMKPAAMTAVLNQEGTHIALMWRHRFATDRWNWELPGGLVDNGEEPSETARREMEEELGFRVKSLRHLVTFEPVIGMVRAAHDVYLARGFEVVGEPTERNEMQRFEWVPLDRVKGLIDNGDISNSGTLVALLYLLAYGSSS